jgi:PadR family transcriptional regulator, regulatory protein PadR
MPAGSKQPTNVLKAWSLLMLRGESAHGYDISRRLGENGLQADRSTIYRTLRDLEACGFVSSGWQPSDDGGPHKRVYKLTRKGRRELARTAQEMADAKAKFDRFVGVYRGEFR